MERPSFRVVLRELSEFMKKSAYFYFLISYLYCRFGTFGIIFFLVTDPDISPSETLTSTGHSIFHKRFLKMKQVLGEVSAVSEFLGVTLCEIAGEKMQSMWRGSDGHASCSLSRVTLER